MRKDDYMFYEWLIIQKKVTLEEFKKLTCQELAQLNMEYRKFKEELEK